MIGHGLVVGVRYTRPLLYILSVISSAFGLVKMDNDFSDAMSV